MSGEKKIGPWRVKNGIQRLNFSHFQTSGWKNESLDTSNDFLSLNSDHFQVPGQKIGLWIHQNDNLKLNSGQFQISEQKNDSSNISK